MKRWKTYTPAVVCAALMVLLVLLGNGRGAQRWDDLHASRLSFPEGMERSGEPCGAINEGPALTLQAGWYTLSWEIETNGANAIELTTTNGAAISPALRGPGHLARGRGRLADNSAGARRGCAEEDEKNGEEARMMRVSPPKKSRSGCFHVGSDRSCVLFVFTLKPALLPQNRHPDPPKPAFEGLPSEECGSEAQSTSNRQRRHPSALRAKDAFSTREASRVRAQPAEGPLPEECGF